jgi:hypothetical protein
MNNFFFDYIYYRINKVYYKWDGENGITALIGVSMIQCLVVFDIFLIGERFFYNKAQVAAKGDSKLIAYIAVTFFLILLIYNGFKYKNKYDEFKNHWIEETQSVRIKKGILVLVVLMMPWVVIFLAATF